MERLIEGTGRRVPPQNAARAGVARSVLHDPADLVVAGVGDEHGAAGVDGNGAQGVERRRRHAAVGAAGGTRAGQGAHHAARQLEFITNPTNSIFEWMRLPGDLLLIIGGVLPFLYLCWLGVRYRVKRDSSAELDEVLFTEITEREPVEAGDR